MVGTLVQILSHGLQLGGGTGAIACTAAVKYKVSPLYTHGELLVYLKFEFNLPLMSAAHFNNVKALTYIAGQI